MYLERIYTLTCINYFYFLISELGILGMNYYKLYHRIEFVMKIKKLCSPPLGMQPRLLTKKMCIYFSSYDSQTIVVRKNIVYFYIIQLRTIKDILFLTFRYFETFEMSNMSKHIGFIGLYVSECTLDMRTGVSSKTNVLWQLWHFKGFKLQK